MSCVASFLTLLCCRFLDIAVAEDLGAVHAARAASSHSIRAIACAEEQLELAYEHAVPTVRRIKKSDGAPAHYQVVLHEARVVRRIFEAVVREQKSLRAVARMLDEQGVPPRAEPKKGQLARWRANAIYSVLRNPSYMGLRCCCRTSSTAIET